jgi:hypothetical protein
MMPQYTQRLRTLYPVEEWYSYYIKPIQGVFDILLTFHHSWFQVLKILSYDFGRDTSQKVSTDMDHVSDMQQNRPVLVFSSPTIIKKYHNYCTWGRMPLFALWRLWCVSFTIFFSFFSVLSSTYLRTVRTHSCPARRSRRRRAAQA